MLRAAGSGRDLPQRLQDPSSPLVAAAATQVELRPGVDGLPGDAADAEQRAALAAPVDTLAIPGGASKGSATSEVAKYARVSRNAGSSACPCPEQEGPDHGLVSAPIFIDA